MDPSTRTFTYTPGGRLHTVTDALGNTVTYGYNARGNRTSRTGLDDAGNPVVQSWTFDGADRLQTATMPATEVGGAASVTSYGYDPTFGRLDTITDPTGNVEARGYYNSGAVKSQTWTKTGQPTVTSQSWINARGWQTKTTNQQDTATTAWTHSLDRTGQRLSSTLDDAGQLTSVSGGPAFAQGTWTYGTRGNRTASTGPDGTTTYSTNPNGSVAATSTGTDAVAYDYDQAGRRLTETHNDGTTDTRTVASSYDTRGILTSLETATPAVTNREDRLYDAAGLTTRSNQSTDGTPTVTADYVYDTNQAVAQLADIRVYGTAWVRTERGASGMTAQKTASSRKWVQTDARGSVVNTDPTNTTAAPGPEAWTAWGQPDQPQPFTHIGYRQETTTDQTIYLRNRNYNPTDGQFLTQDPLDSVDGTATVGNPYHYTNNDPLNRVDPLGLRPDDEEMCKPNRIDYGNSKPKVEKAAFRSSKGGRGVVRVGLYIPTNTAGLPGPNIGKSHGDDRGPCPNADLSQYRAVATIDYGRGLAEFRINPSCGTGGPPNDCHDPLPITNDFSTAGRWFQRVPLVVDDSNRVSLGEDRDGYKIRWAILNSDKRLVAPAIDGSVTLTPLGVRNVCVEYQRDSYPALEIYQYRTGMPVKDLLLQGAAHNAERGLLPLPFTDKRGSTC